MAGSSFIVFLSISYITHFQQSYGWLKSIKLEAIDSKHLHRKQFNAHPSWSWLRRWGRESGRPRRSPPDCCGVLRYIIHDMLISSQTLCGRKTRPSRDVLFMFVTSTFSKLHYTLLSFRSDEKFLFFFYHLYCGVPLLYSIEFSYLKLSLYSLLMIRLLSIKIKIIHSVWRCPQISGGCPLHWHFQT